MSTDASSPSVPPVDDANALTNVAFAPEVVGQTLEAVLVCLEADGAHLLRPMHADTLRLGWSPDLRPEEVVIDAACRYELEPILVHSTSWRLEQGRIVLTYVVAVQAPTALDQHLVDEPVARTDLARGDAMGRAPDIGISQVIEHAFRHLAWLIKDDATVRDALPDWAAFLADYEPEPFRAFGSPTSS